MIVDPKCGKTWGGLRTEHCTICHETFSGQTAGDAHRGGPHKARVCYEPESVGLVLDDKGVWRNPGSPGTYWQSNPVEDLTA